MLTHRYSNVLFPLCIAYLTKILCLPNLGFEPSRPIPKGAHTQQWFEQIRVNPTKVSDAKAFGLTPSTVSVFLCSLHGFGQAHRGQKKPPICMNTAADLNGLTQQDNDLH